MPIKKKDQIVSRKDTTFTDWSHRSPAVVTTKKSTATAKNGTTYERRTYTYHDNGQYNDVRNPDTAYQVTPKSKNSFGEFGESRAGSRKNYEKVKAKVEKRLK